MSRSIKKNAIVKDKNRGAKHDANRRLRRRVKMEVNKDKEVLSVTNEITNQYDVCDWIFRANKGDRWYTKFKRK